MTYQPQTKWVGGNPFPSPPPKPKRTRKPRTFQHPPIAIEITKDPMPTKRTYKPFDMSKIEITKEPYTPTPNRPRGEFDELFARLEYDERIKCPPEYVSTIRKALRRWIKANKVKGVIRSTEHHTDGRGGVWLREA